MSRPFPRFLAVEEEVVDPALAAHMSKGSNFSLKRCTKPGLTKNGIGVPANIINSMSQFFEQYWFGAALAKALGKEGAQQYSADEMNCLQGFENFACTLRADLSSGPATPS